MHIAIDIDGVLTNQEKFAKETGKAFFKKDVVNEAGEDLDEIFGVSKKEKDRFWNENFMDYIDNWPLREGAVEMCEKLHQKGWLISIVTARKFYPIYGCKTKEEFQERTMESLKSRGLYFDDIYFYDSPKVKAVGDLGIDVFLEDNPYNIEHLAKVTKVIIVDCSYNRNLNIPNTYRVSSLGDVADLIENIK